ncbi:hypothetical protein TELCIR_25211 [Teladorsagia circumcincta]|uniref:BRCT domain-containing protein n=1 Tax=Teladorsagia circumcincta TaxID=45464 RepID=A0A2G9T681_TELCI|nr:hypothetical protein TELCIR_25211 [Teladorsagia circumcincta]
MFGDDDNALADKVKESKLIKNLFKGLVFFLNRETPKEALTLIIRNCGGVVGWSGGPTNLEESNPSITHQIVDRPMSKFDVNRCEFRNCSHNLETLCFLFMPFLYFNVT